MRLFLIIANFQLILVLTSSTYKSIIFFFSRFLNLRIWAIISELPFSHSKTARIFGCRKKLQEWDRLKSPGEVCQDVGEVPHHLHQPKHQRKGDEISNTFLIFPFYLFHFLSSSLSLSFSFSSALFLFLPTYLSLTVYFYLSLSHPLCYFYTAKYSSKSFSHYFAVV